MQYISQVIKIIVVIFIFIGILRIINNFDNGNIHKKRAASKSVIEFFAASIATAYSIYLICYFYSIGTDLGSSIATLLVTPHMICCVLGSVFMWVAFFRNNQGMALTGAIMFCVSAVLFITYAPLTLPTIILGFIGYSRIGTIRKNYEHTLHHY